MYGTIVGTVDLAQVSLYLFWLFFAGLVFYLQRENMREGYPLENEDGTPAPNTGPFPLPSPKTFRLPHGRGLVSFPNNDKQDDRPLAMEQVSPSAGSPFVPTGNPLADGVGPAAWAMRRDEPELDGHGHPKIRPMAQLAEFGIAAGKDARGMPVMSADGKVVGTVTDMWIDVPESLVRYLQYDLAGGGSRLLPVQLANWYWSNSVHVHSLYAKDFAGIPTIANAGQITKLEEEKVCAYYCGGKLYASEDRLEPQI